MHFKMLSAIFFNLDQSKIFSFGNGLILSSIYTHSYTLKKKGFRETMWKKAKLLNFTFFHNVFYAIDILKALNSHISVVVFSFFEFGMISKLCIREWVKLDPSIRVFIYSICAMIMYWEEKKIHKEKGRKCWFSAFSPFPTLFSKSLLPVDCYKAGLFGKMLKKKGQCGWLITNQKRDITMSKMHCWFTVLVV